MLLLRAGRIKVHFFPFRKKAKQNKTKQNKTKQNKTKQNKTKQNKTKNISSPKSTSSPNTIMLRRFNKASHDCNSLFTSPKPSTPKNRSRCQSPPSHSTHLTRKFPQRSGTQEDGSKEETHEIFNARSAKAAS
jgi:hypothetical protein